MKDDRSQQKDKLVADIKAVMTELDELVRDSSAEVGEELVDLKDKLNEQVRAARATLSDLEVRVTDRARDAARAGDDYVHDHPWTSIGVAAGVGVLIGLLLNRR